MHYLKIRSLEQLQKVLTDRGIKWERWGKTPETRSVSKLWHMIKVREVRVYSDEDGRIILEVKSVGIDVFSRVPNNDSVVELLVEKRYHVHGNKAINRKLRHSVGGNVRPRESRMTSAKRAIRTELGRKTKIKMIELSEEHDPIDHSRWFPELFVDRKRYHFVGILLHDERSGVIEFERHKRSNGSPERTIAYSWKPVKVTALPLIVSDFIANCGHWRGVCRDCPHRK